MVFDIKVNKITTGALSAGPLSEIGPYAQINVAFASVQEVQAFPRQEDLVPDHEFSA
jgi:hypothetical protein